MRLLRSECDRLVLIDCTIYRNRIEAGACYVGSGLPAEIAVSSELGQKAIVRLPDAFQKVATQAFEVNTVVKRGDIRD